MKLRPFFTYYGGKWRIAPRYPVPERSLIVEPFAGAAGYATRHHDRDVLLLDMDPVIIGIWKYLIRTPAAEILRIPIGIAHVDEISGPEERKWLVGFWLNKGTTHPCKKPGFWMRKTLNDGGYSTGGSAPSNWWGESVRERIASQVDQIRHWRAEMWHYSHAPDSDATWFIDPPYHASGKRYKFHDIDFASLGEWCRTRIGQVIVCEQDGANWLPFEPFASVKALEGKRGKKRSAEVVWMNHKKSDEARVEYPLRTGRMSA